jgi:hypothetical protein
MTDFNPRFSAFGTAPESPVDERDFEIRPLLAKAGAELRAADLPDEVGTINADVHRAYLSITDQGQEGSCTGHSLRNVKGVNERRWRSPSAARRVPDFGPRGIYTLAKQVGGYPDEEGAYMRDVLKAANQLGVPREKDWPYVPCVNEGGAREEIGTPISRWLQYARPWVVGAYARVRTLDEMLATLHTVGPLHFAMDVTESFITPDARGWIPPTPFGETLGGHAMCILSAKQSDRRFLVANSWGTGWGADGYCWLDFDHLLTRARSEVWAVPDALLQ